MQNVTFAPLNNFILIEILNVERQYRKRENILWKYKYWIILQFVINLFNLTYSNIYLSIWYAFKILITSSLTIPYTIIISLPIVEWVYQIQWPHVKMFRDKLIFRKHLISHPRHHQYSYLALCCVFTKRKQLCIWHRIIVCCVRTYFNNNITIIIFKFIFLLELNMYYTSSSHRYTFVCWLAVVFAYRFECTVCTITQCAHSSLLQVTKLI